MALGAFLTYVPVALAHEGGELGVQLTVERIAPGDSLPIVGTDWAIDVFLDVWMQFPGGDRVRIGSVRTGPDGHFLAALPVPATAPTGPAAVEVVSTYGVRDTVLVEVDPTAPRPSIPTGTTSGEPGSGGAFDPVPIVALATAVGLLGLLVLRTRKHEPVVRSRDRSLS